MDDGPIDRRGLMRAGAAAAAGVAVGGVVGASPAAAGDATTLRSGSVLFAPGETSKVVTVPGGLTSTSRAFAMTQSPLRAKVNLPAWVMTAHPDRASGTLTIEIQDEGGNYRFWSVTVAWFVHG